MRLATGSVALRLAGDSIAIAADSSTRTDSALGPSYDSLAKNLFVASRCGISSTATMPTAYPDSIAAESRTRTMAQLTLPLHLPPEGDSCKDPIVDLAIATKALDTA